VAEDAWNPDGDDDARSDIRTAPFPATGPERRADAEIRMADADVVRTPMIARAGSLRRRWSRRLLGVTIIGPDVILAEEGINISAAVKNAVDDDRRLRDMEGDGDTAAEGSDA
jgi:hypothetical protein